MSDTTGDILVMIEDEGTRLDLGRHLMGQGHLVMAVRTREAVLGLLKSRSFDLVILSTPSGSEASSFVRRLREDTAVGIMLVSDGSSADDRAHGLELGADDYLSPPFHWREVRARVASLLRRVRQRRNGRIDSTIARCAGWMVDPIKRELVDTDGEPVPLTAAEFDLLMALLSRPLRVVEREQLLKTVAGRGWSPEDRAIDQHISRLRRKLRDQPRNPRLIKTIRGRGYLLAAPVAWERGAALPAGGP